MTGLHDMTAVDQRDLLRTGDLTPAGLVEHYLGRVTAGNDAVGAFRTVTPEAARARAAEVTAGSDRSAALWGMPLADKDLGDRAGVPTGFGSRAWSGRHRYVPEVSGDVALVLDAAGAVSLGKTTAPELGFPATTEPLAGPVARNPWDTGRSAGGSSGGAAAAVAAGLLPFAPGSDGGGSIRIPAAACGLVGLKPTRGLLPAGGGVESLGGLVVHGPIARTVADTALLLEGMLPRRADGSVEHPRTLRTAAGPAGSYLDAARRGATPDGRASFRIGVSTFSAWADAYEIALGPDARAALDAAAVALGALGHDVEDAGTWEPDPTYAPAFRTLWMGGASAVPLDDPERLALLEPLTRWLIERGRTVTARALAEALADLARFERTLVARVERFDAVLLPAMAMTPRPLGWYDAEDPERNFAQQCAYTPYTSMINVAGLPAVTVPVLWTDPDEGAPRGLPMGVQLVGRSGGEHVLLAIAAQLEDRLRWPDRRPPVW
ncbi:amidase [Cellulomonas hominis]|uniref:Amidase n=1 Tax=Cellulomonas hominis TaxID=156981 RepID=A0A511FDH9_9CELL|nr:amidase [Cellulomonas hominis]MBB5472985.1 amidase [Cellulomonas hominis]GEL45878.1 amidase [Cellulomonas hominis]